MVQYVSEEGLKPEHSELLCIDSSVISLFGVITDTLL